MTTLSLMGQSIPPDNADKNANTIDCGLNFRQLT